MSKRFAGHQQQGERKKAKLVVNKSDHNFPLSQNASYKEPEQDNWGDDIDEKILLLACEKAYNSSPYNIFKFLESEPTPSTSKSSFVFKKPPPFGAQVPSVISTDLKNKNKTISSPLTLLPTKKQLLQLQEENAKLKSDNDKLLDECVTKEGEAAILRTQLMSYQLAADNAHMEKVSAQQRAEREWIKKLTAVNKEMLDLKTQLDFKNLEMLSIQEKCKMLESNKLKLTQVTVGNNHISVSQINNSNLLTNDPISQSWKLKMISNGVQTDDRSGSLTLDKIFRKENSKLVKILPLMADNSGQQQHSVLDYNENLKEQSDSQNKCRIFSTFHRVPLTPVINKEVSRTKKNLNHIYKDLTFIAANNGDMEIFQKIYFNIFNVLNSVLQDIQYELETILQKMTNAFQKEMDERYIEATSSFIMIKREDLLKSSALYKDEQAIFSRKMTAVAAYAIETFEVFQIYEMFEEQYCYAFLDSVDRICNLLYSTSCGVLYSGLLLSFIILLETYLDKMKCKTEIIIKISKVILSLRPMPVVSSNILVLIRRLSILPNFLPMYCPGGISCNLEVDYDQGVLLYKKDSCYLQILLKQNEASLKCIETQKIRNEALSTTRNLITVYSNVNHGGRLGIQKTKCDCHLMLIQVITFSLRICAVMLKDSKNTEDMSYDRELLAVCRSGIQMLYQCTLRDMEFSLQMTHYEGYFLDLCQIIKEFDHSEVFGNMLQELASTF